MKFTDLRGILQYIPRFREKVFVISIDGAIVTDENFANILLDVAVLRSLNIRIVLVHGASAQIRKLADEQHVAASDLEGSGITDSDTLKLALTAANRLTHEILEGLSANDLRAACTNAIIAHPMGIIQGVDHLLTGKVERVDTELFQTLLEEGIVPVVPPLGFDGDGKTYRVNSDGVAVAIADALKAIKLIFITTQDGLFRQGRLFRQILAGDLETLLSQHKEEVAPEVLSKAVHAAAACRAGVPRVHVINGRVNEGLLAEVFSNEGIGTLVYVSEYQQVRRALKKDIRNILMLTQASVASEELVKRTRTTLEKQLGDYYIFEIDKNPVGCVALHVYPEQKKGELACLYVKSSHENAGIGRKLINFVENRARELGLNELLALSTQAFTYFQSKGGFTEGTPDDLPPARREKYDQSGRNSKILLKKLNPEQSGDTAQPWMNSGNSVLTLRPTERWSGVSSERRTSGCGSRRRRSDETPLQGTVKHYRRRSSAQPYWLPQVPQAFLWTCRRWDVKLTRFVLLTSVARQQVWLFERRRGHGFRPGLQGQYTLRRRYRASTSRFGTGQQSGSNQTPLGLHRIKERIGAGCPVGTVFESRRAIGFVWQGRPDAAIAHRILWLEGLEPGFNQGGPVDSHARYIYIHGLADEPSLGRPASRGCIHLAASDLMPLFDLLPSGTLVWIC